MEHSAFNAIAEAYLQNLADRLEDIDTDYQLEVEYEQAVLTIDVAGKQYVINKHGPTKQIWFSSPLSNVGRLVYEADTWCIDGQPYHEILRKELVELTQNQGFAALSPH